MLGEMPTDGQVESEMSNTVSESVSESGHESIDTGLESQVGEDPVGHREKPRTPGAHIGGDIDDEPIEDPRVLAAIERLADLEGLPIAEQVEVFADVHARLAEALGTESDLAGNETIESMSSESVSATGQVSFGDPAS
jgi:hypothetical protein